jgi:anti-sigma-K factor RskA
MTDRTDFENLQELVAGHVLGNLTPEEAETLQQLLTAHPSIAAEMQLMQEVLAAMPYGLPAVEPPQHLRSNILAATQPPAPRRVIRWWKTAALASSSIAALVVMTVLGVDNYQLRQRLSSTQARLVDARYYLGTTQAQVDQQQQLVTTLQQPSTKLIALRGMDPFSNAAGNLIVSPNQRESILILQHLPILPPGQSYQLWSVVKDKKLAAGNFNADADGQVFVKVAIDQMARVPNLIVTVEVTPHPEKPGPTVMTSSL